MCGTSGSQAGGRGVGGGGGGGGCTRPAPAVVRGALPGSGRFGVLDVRGRVPPERDDPAVPEHVRAARDFVVRVLGESHAHVDLALLPASELVTNSVRHGDSAVPGGTVAAGDEVVRVEVTDRIGDGVPVLPSAAEAAEGGRGLWLGGTRAR